VVVVGAVDRMGIDRRILDTPGRLGHAGSLVPLPQYF
jgi:hypothetical protein